MSAVLNAKLEGSQLVTRMRALEDALADYASEEVVRRMALQTTLAWLERHKQ